MKFGKLLEEYQLPEWQGHYLRYNVLKKSLYDIQNKVEADTRVKRGPSAFLRSSMSLAHKGPSNTSGQDLMILALDDTRFAKDPATAWMAVTEAEVVRIGQFVDSNFDDLTSQLGHLCDIADSETGSKAYGHFSELRMLQALERLSEHVQRLRYFAELNHAALYKLMKKYDKVLKREEKDGLKTEYPRMLNMTGLSNVDRFDTLEAEIRKEFQRKSAYKGLEGSAEVARLCAGLGTTGAANAGVGQGLSRFEKLLYFFLGSSTALMMSILVLILLPPSKPKTYSNAYFMSSFCVFQFLFSVQLVFWGMGAAARTCDVNFINHMFLLDIDPRCRVGPDWLFSRAGGLISLWILIFGMYIVDYKWNVFPEFSSTTGFNDRASAHFVAYPLSILVLTLGVIFLPSRICRCRYKKALARSVQRTACAPFYPVTFGDNIVGDVMTSLAKPLQDIPASICYLASHHPQMQISVDRFIAHGDSCPDWEHHTITPLLAALPFWFRLLQCARRFYDTKDLRHLANLGKYFASLLVVLVSQGGPLAFGGKVLVIVSVTATVYAAAWDVFMDWGLSGSELFVLAKLSYETPRGEDGNLLSARSEMQCRRHFGPSFYWFAVIFDVLARSSWVLTLMPLNIITDNLIQRSVLKTFISSLEILRRSLWAVLRIEHEQVANASGYRARVWVPMRPQPEDVTHAHSKDSIASKKVLSAPGVGEKLSQAKEPLLSVFGGGA